jgi:hypothetical protein
MTSIDAPFHPVLGQADVIETSAAFYESFEDNQDVEYSDMEMADASQKQIPLENNEEQDTYNAEIESTVVEPSQSDAVMTHAPSTILDEMEYLDPIDYEEADPISPKPHPDDNLIRETDTYKVLPSFWHIHIANGESDYDVQADTTTAPTPPARSPEATTQIQLFSPGNRPVPLPRSQTPHLAALAASTSAAAGAGTAGDADEDTAGVVLLDDDWPICLYTPGGQEYMLFRSDGDTEALFEDNWLKSQPLETFFSSIRQTLENELIPLTTSFAMDEIVLAIPDLELSIAEVRNPYPTETPQTAIYPAFEQVANASFRIIVIRERSVFKIL